MTSILEKLSSYNLFNYLLPGVLFVGISQYLLPINLIQENLLIGLFLYYFIGLVCSRIGSIVIEPLLKKLKILNFAPYGDFITASKKDEQIKVLSEVNNMYRTILGMFLLLASIKLYYLVSQKIEFLANYDLSIGLTLGVLLFVFSYKKQTDYIRKRVGKNTS